MIQQPNQSEIVLYTTTDGTVKIDTVFQNETIWLYPQIPGTQYLTIDNRDLR